MMNELHGDERTVRLSDGTPVTMNMPCTLTSGKGGSFRMYAEVQVVEIDPSGNYLVIQLRSGETMKLQSNPQPFQFRDLQASVNFDMLLGLSGGAKRASDHSELEYSRTDPTAGDGCLNSSEMLNLFKVLVTEACDPSYRSQLLREFSSRPEYAVFPAPAGANVQHENIYLARCLAHQLVTEDMNEFLRADKVSCVSIGNVCGRYWCIHSSQFCFILASLGIIASLVPPPLIRHPSVQDNERQMHYAFSQFPPNSGLPWSVLRMVIKTKHNGIPVAGALPGVMYV
jgi:hypothetical protein